MYIIVTIDVEEDNWGMFNLPKYTVKNIGRIPGLQELFDKYNVRPTYLLTYPVATDNVAISIFNEIVHTGRCEIGTHPHPWNTPPIEEERNERNSMMCNLPIDLQYKKIKTLHETIQNNFKISPISFRSGRWGFDGGVAKNIYKLGYKIDTSIRAYKDFRSLSGPSFANCTSTPYRFLEDDILKPIANGSMLEIPATAGFLQNDNSLLVKLFQLSSKRPYNWIKIRSILKKMKIVRRISLSPEVYDSKMMIRLTEKLQSSGQDLVNLFFHSTSLLAGYSPYTKTIEDEMKIMENIEEYLDFAGKNNFKSITLSDSLNIY